MKTFLFQVYSRDPACDASSLQAQYPDQITEALAERLIYAISLGSLGEGGALSPLRIGLTPLGRRRLIGRG